MMMTTRQLVVVVVVAVASVKEDTNYGEGGRQHWQYYDCGGDNANRASMATLKVVVMLTLIHGSIQPAPKPTCPKTRRPAGTQDWRLFGDEARLRIAHSRLSPGAGIAAT